MFRNATIFCFPASVNFDDLDAGLAEMALKPVGPLEMSSTGFVSPFGQGETLLSDRVGDFILISAGSEDKILPGSVINNMLHKKLAEIEETEGRKLGGRARKKLKEDLVHELLPRALVRPGRTDAIIDTERGVIIVDTSSRRTAESVVGLIRQALGSFPALPLNAEVAPRSILTGWIAGDPLPAGLTLGDECELRDPADDGSKVRCIGQELEGDEIAKHLEAGKQVSRLALAMDDTVSFVFGEDLTIRKLKFLDAAFEQLESTEREDLHAELEARFFLQSELFGRLFDVLRLPFKFSTPEEAPDHKPLPRSNESLRNESITDAAHRAIARQSATTVEG